MRVVIGLGGNALLRRGEVPTAEAQRRNVLVAARAVAEVAREHEVVVTHGNGPQVGLLAMEQEGPAELHYPLDVLGAETEGMIGYLVSQELRNVLPGREIATLLTQVEVDGTDPAFASPSKPIGPVHSEAQARRLEQARGWVMAEDGDGWRRVVASPRPKRILELPVVKTMMENHILVVCAGGGGIPVKVDDSGRLSGVEAVIDKDRTTALLASDLGADALLLLTDVDGVYRNFGSPSAERLERLSLGEFDALSLPEGSMAPKVRSCARFVGVTGGFAAVGSLEDAAAVLRGEAGTRIVR